MGALNSTSSRNRTGISKHDSRTDDSLLAAIGSQHDEKAFQELFRRHGTAVTNLARHLTRDKALAEEAIQEGMLNVWLKAHTYVPDRARAWILRIVANQSLKLLKTRARHARTDEPQTIAELNAFKPTVPAPSDQEELLEAVNHALEQLPVRSRQVLTLYYCAGYSQCEIGRALSMPQRTVSFKLRETLEKMRAMLTAAGMSAALPLLSADGLLKAIGTGPAPSSSLCVRLTSQVASHNKPTHLNTSPRRPGRGLLPWVLVGFMGALAAGALYWQGNTDYIAPGKSADLVTKPNSKTIANPRTTHNETEISHKDKIIYDDDFIKAPIAPFWTTRLPLKNARIGTGKKASMLVLSVDARGSKNQKGESVELESKLISLDTDLSMYFALTPGNIKGKGGFSLGLEILDQHRTSIYKQGITFELEGKQHYTTKFLFLMGQADHGNTRRDPYDPTIKFFLSGALEVNYDPVPEQRIVSKAHDFVETNLGRIKTNGFRLRLFITAKPGAYVSWPIDRINLSHAPLKQQPPEEFDVFGSAFEGIQSPE